jgi:hypothetical protein
MDPIIVLIGIAVVLAAYQLFLVKDYDKLDANGQEVYMKNKRG